MIFAHIKLSKRLPNIFHGHCIGPTWISFTPKGLQKNVETESSDGFDHKYELKLKFSWMKQQYFEPETFVLLSFPF